jgi:hypothetical protein
MKTPEQTLRDAAFDMLQALIVAREFLSCERNAFADANVMPSGRFFPSDQAELDDYDQALRQIDAAIAKATAANVQPVKA